MTSKDRVEHIIHEARFPDRGLSREVNRAIEGIEGLFAAGQITPGQRLIEEDLARRIGVGRGRIREALRILAGEGVIELKANSGARYRDLGLEELVLIAEVGTHLFASGIEAFLRRHHLLDKTVFDDLANAKDRIFQDMDSPLKIILRSTEYHLVVNHYSANFYVNKLHSVLHTERHNIEFSTKIPREIVNEFAMSFHKMHDLLLKGDAGALDILRNNKVMMQDAIYARISSALP